MNTVLIVEDDAMSANLIRSLLQKPGAHEFEVEITDRLETARQRLEAARFDVILLDLTLPDSQGLDTVLAVRIAAPQTPIIVLTNIHDDQLALQAIEARAQDYLIKSQVNGLLLSRVVRHAISQQTLLAELQAQTRAAELESTERQRAEDKLLASLNSLGAVEKTLDTQYHALRSARQNANQEHVRFETLARIAPVGIFQTDAAGRCVYVNRRWTEIAGLPSELALQVGWLQAIFPDDRERVATEWDQAVHAQLPFSLEYRFGGAEGRPVTWVLGQSAPELDAAGHVTGFVGTITDITARKQAEEQIRQLNLELEARVTARTADLLARTEELHHANAALQTAAQRNNDLIANLSRDLHTPLAALLQVAEALAGGDYGTPEPRQREALQEILKNARQLLALLDNLRDGGKA